MSQNSEYFGKYILLEKLATGGMAEVFLAKAPGAGGIAKFVAIKRILPQYSDNQEFIDMFKDEAKIAINLSHSNIVSIYEFGVEKGQFFLVMDYVEGRNLRQILNKMKKDKTKFGIDQIVFIIKEVAAGLDHAHRCLDGSNGKPLNITHRDMSPQNVMISFEGEIKIVDFGIAKAESQLENTRAGTLKGKFGYMSPEQAEAQPVDLRTDIFSIGIVMWELLANDRLFIANNEMNTLRKIRDCQVPSLRKINPNIHAELERICMKALAKDRNLRYQTAAAMHRDLNRFLNRQYPDFSPQDLAVSIKSLYADEILDGRKRLIQYARIGGRNETSIDIPIDDKTEVTDTATSPPTGLDPSRFQTHTDRDPSTNTVSESKVDFFTKADATAYPTHVTRPESPALTPPTHEVADDNPKATGLDMEAIKNELNNTRGYRGREISEGDPTIYDPNAFKKSRNGKRKSKPRSAFVSYLVTMALFLGSYIAADFFAPQQMKVVKEYFSRQMNDLFSGGSMTAQLPSESGTSDFSSQPPSSVPAEAGEVEPLPTSPSAPAQYPTQKPQMAVRPVVTPTEPQEEPLDLSQLPKVTALIINSNPSGAEIYVDGRITGKTTPSRVEVPGNRPFELTLKKERYIDYQIPDLAVYELKGRSFSATLQRAMIAYVDIDVKPPANVKIFLNGRHLKGENLPISRYAVPAGTPISIRAENPITGSHAEKSLTLGQDERKSVILTLEKDKNSRRPSHSNP